MSNFFPNSPKNESPRIPETNPSNMAMIGNPLPQQLSNFSGDIMPGTLSGSNAFNNMQGMQGMGMQGMQMQGMSMQGMGMQGMGMQGMGMQGSSNFPFASGDSSSSSFLSQGSQFVPEISLGALMRARDRNMNMNMNNMSNMMNMNMMQQMKMPGGSDADQDFPNKGNVSISSTMIDRHLKRSAAESSQGSVNNEKDAEEDSQPANKKQKKSKRPSDMPRRALSAYNIFFSEQRGLILKEIEAKESGKEPDSEDKAEKNNDSEEKEKPSVLNRTFFPTRAKRAHRKVHGKIGLVQLARTVSQRWKDLPTDKRKHYQDLAEEDRRRHKKVMAEYQEKKAAENMVSMVPPSAASAATAVAASAMSQPGEDALASSNNNQQMTSEQQMREEMAHQYQQRILAEMLAARQQQQSSAQQGLGFNPMMNFSGQGTHPNFAARAQVEQNMLMQARRNQQMNQQQQNNMWNNMGMGPMGPGMGPM